MLEAREPVWAKMTVVQRTVYVYMYPWKVVFHTIFNTLKNISPILIMLILQMNETEELRWITHKLPKSIAKKEFRYYSYKFMASSIYSLHYPEFRCIFYSSFHDFI